jgi:hypothetical protein
VPSSSPRPFAHPVRTPGGTVLTDARPADHDWHLGLGFTVADADGTNFWGGGTFVRDRGYVDLDDHGSQRIEAIRASRQTAELDLTWIDRDGSPVLTERRTHRVESLGDGVTRITLGTTLVADRRVTLGSPATHGRERAGYGGWFWRLPPCADVGVLGAGGLVGEDAVLGSTVPWISWTGRFLGTPGATGDATVVLTQPGHADPWFVRAAAYPGIGTAVAWERPTVIEPGVPFTRSLVAVVADGRRDPAELLSSASVR